MFKAKVILLFPVALLLTHCSQQNLTPFHVDEQRGSYTLFRDGALQVSSWIEVNGENVLKDVYLFHEKERLVAISSQRQLDIIAEFSGDSTRGSIQLTLHNPGEESQAVNHVQLFNMQIEAESGALLISEKLVQLSAPGDPRGVVCLKTGSGLPWSLIFDHQEDQITCSLDLSNSSVILLPQEELSLPLLEFFYHLCSE